MKRLLKPYVLRFFGLSILAGSGFAGVIGFHDVLWPVSLPGEILGAVFLGAGLAGAAGAWPLLRDAASLSCLVQQQIYPSGRLSVVTIGSVGVTYTSTTIALYAYRYQPVKAILFGLLALICAGVAVAMLPAFWSAISRAVKAVGLSLTVLATVIGGWYQAIYLPQNAQVGIEYTLTLRSVVQSDSQTLADLQLTMENLSSVTALSVGSMVEVSGLSYTSGKPNALSNDAAERQLIDYASAQAGSNSDVRFGGSENSTVLAVLRPINNDSYLFPDDIYTHDFVVVIPETGFAALTVRIFMQYVRTTRIVLGSELPLQPVPPRGCKHGERYSWSIEQSALRTFTTGALQLNSYWCADLGDPFIAYGISGVAGHESPAEQQAIAYRLGIYSSSRSEELTFSYPAASTSLRPGTEGP